MNVIFLSQEAVGPVKSGTSARLLELAHATSQSLNTFLCDLSDPLSHSLYRVRPDASSHSLELIDRRQGQRIAQNEPAVCVAQSSHPINGWIQARGTTETYIVLDFYCCFWFENIVASAKNGRFSDTQYRHDIYRLATNIKLADHFLVATQGQRTLLIGMLTILGLTPPMVMKSDPTLDSRSSIVPFGIPEQFPDTSPENVYTYLPGVADSAKVLVWGGGLHDWLDAEAIVQAMALVHSERQDIVVLFAAAQSHPDRGRSNEAARVAQLAQNLGLLGRTVFLNDGWVPYVKRAQYLTGAMAGIVTHRKHLETEFSFRTRVVDYLWAGLPVITTEGDHFANEVETHNIGVVCRSDNPRDLSTQILGLVKKLETPKVFDERISLYRKRYTWTIVSKPLVQFCRNPLHAQRSATIAPTQAPWAGRQLNRLQILLSMIRQGQRKVALNLTSNFLMSRLKRFLRAF